MKTCSQCRSEKPETEFYKHYRSGLQDKCKECKSAYNREHYKKDKAAYVDRALKSNLLKRQEFREKLDKIKSVPCFDCGVQYEPWVMDFDHLSNKEFQISQAAWRSWRKVLKEIAKCQIVCSNCHRARTHQRSHIP